MNTPNNIALVAARGSINSVLAHPAPPVMFDPANKAHRMAFAHFLQSGRWAPDAQRFQVEWPHTSAVTTIQTKLVNYALKKELAKIEADIAMSTEQEVAQEAAELAA